MSHTMNTTHPSDGVAQINLSSSSGGDSSVRKKGNNDDDEVSSPNNGDEMVKEFTRAKALSSEEDTGDDGFGTSESNTFFPVNSKLARMIFASDDEESDEDEINGDVPDKQDSTIAAKQREDSKILSQIEDLDGEEFGSAQDAQQKTHLKRKKRKGLNR